MDCNKANKLMMKFMDNTISEEKYLLLEEHLEECAECQNDFSIYTEILEGFSNDMEILEVHEDFEEKIMQKIEHIEPNYTKNKKITNIFYWTIGIVSSFLLGLNLFFNFNKIYVTEKFNLISFKYILEEFNNILNNFFNFIINLMQNIFCFFQENMIIFISNLKVICFIGIIALIILNYKNYIKNKIKV